MIPVDRAERCGGRGRHEIEILVRQVTTPENEIDAPGARRQRGGDRLVLDIADREDAHAFSVNRMSRTALWNTASVNAHVAWIHVAPIKALAVQELEQVELGLLGVENDRRFCIVDPDGRMLNAKRVQRFVAVRPRFDQTLRHLVLEMPDRRKVKGTTDLGAPTLVTIPGRVFPAHIVEGPWSAALSDLAARPVRLIRFDAPGEGVDRADEGGGASLRAEQTLR